MLFKTAVVLVNLAFCLGMIPIKDVKHIGPHSHMVSPHIVGGQLAQDRQFPWQVAVYFDTSRGTFFCAGALISNQYVVTTGHCVHDALIFTLHFGANSLVTDDSNRVTVATVTSVVHPDYTVNPLRNDIGLIKLRSPIELNEFITPIELYTDTAPGNLGVVVSGWGQTGDWDSGVTNDLHYINLTTISNAACSRVYGSHVVEETICTVGEENGGICTGDSGSPLVTYRDGNPVLVAIATFVSSAGCESGDPSGHTRISPYIDWIEAETGLTFE